MPTIIFIALLVYRVQTKNHFSMENGLRQATYSYYNVCITFTFCTFLMNTTPEQSTPRVQNTTSSFLSDVFRFALIALFIILPIRLFVAQPFVVSGASMEPTFSSGEYLIVDELTYRLNDPERGDVIIFRFPEETSTFFIKRVIGLPGETIHIQNGKVTIINSDHPNGFAIEEPYITHPSSERFSVSLKQDEYFVLGDNRRASSDSRVWGPLNSEFIIGRALLRLLPITTINIFPGKKELS